MSAGEGAEHGGQRRCPLTSTSNFAEADARLPCTTIGCGVKAVADSGGETLTPVCQVGPGPLGSQGDHVSCACLVPGCIVCGEHRLRGASSA